MARLIIAGESLIESARQRANRGSPRHFHVAKAFFPDWNTAPMAGLYFEQFEIGAEFSHEIRRTVTETDNLLFTTLTHNPQPLHLDAEFARQTHYGQILVNSYFTLALVVGISVGDTTLGTTIGNLGMEKVEFPNPVFIGDTLRVKTRVLDKRESRSRPDRGVVWFEHVGINQRGEVVCECQRKGMMRRVPK